MTASLAAELKALADLKADGTLTPEQFERAKEVVLSGDAIPDAPADGDDDEPPGTSANDDIANAKRENLGYMRFWSSAFTPFEKGTLGMLCPKDHHLEWREHLAASKQRDGASLRDGLTGTYETEIVFAALVLGINFSVFFSAVDEDAYAAVRDLRASSARFWLVVVGYFSILMAWVSIAGIYLLLVCIAPISDTNLPTFIRSSSAMRCLMAPNITIVAMFYSTLFFYLLAVLVPSEGAGVLIGIAMFSLLATFCVMFTFMTPFNFAVNAGCFADEPAIQPAMDLAACTGDDVDRALRKKALDNVARFGMPKGPPGFASAPAAFLIHLYSSGSLPLRKTSRARRMFGIKKKAAVVSGALH